MEIQTHLNDAAVRVDGVNQRNLTVESDMLWRHVENIIPRHGKRVRIEGKELHTYFESQSVINFATLQNKVIVQTQNGLYMLEI